MKRTSTQNRHAELIRVVKHEFQAMIKEHVKWRKKHDACPTTYLLEMWYRDFARYLYTLDQREITLNNAGFGVKYIQWLMDKGTIGNYRIRNMYDTMLATLNRLDIMHGFRSKELFRDFAKVDKSNEDFFMTNEEVKELLDLEVETKLERIVLDRFLVACFTGARISEVTSIKVIDEGTLQYTSVKSKKDVRVPFSKQIKYAFLDEVFRERLVKTEYKYSENRVLHQIFKRLKWTDKVKVYKQHGKNKTSSMVPRWKLLTFHSARKFYGKMLLDMDVPIYKVSQLLGHGSVVTTEKYYAALTKDKMIDEVQDKINSF